MDTSNIAESTPTAPKAQQSLDGFMADIVKEIGLPMTAGSRVPISQLLEKAITYTDIRELTDEDLRKLHMAEETELKPKESITELGQRHHRMARMLAAGFNVDHVAQALGTTRSAIERLDSDPAFQSLKATYLDTQLDDREIMSLRLMDITGEALSVMLKRLEDAPEGFTNAQLAELIKTVSDRAGFAPVSKSMNVNISGQLSSSDLKSLKAEAMQSNVSQIVFVESSSEGGTLPGQAQESRGLTYSEPDNSPQQIDATFEEIERQAG